MTTFEDALNKLRLNGCKYWTIRKSKESNTYLFKADINKGFDDNIKDTRAAMVNEYGAYYMLEGKENENSNKGSFLWEFALEKDRTTPTAAVISGTPTLPPSGLTEADINQRIENAVKASEIAMQRKDLERREKELTQREREYRAEKASTIGIIVDKIGKVLPRIFPQVSVAGLPGEQVEIPSDSGHHIDDIDISTGNGEITTEQIESLLERFSTVEPEWFTLLSNIVAMAESQDNTYTMARTFLLNK